jgi:hypothetical protein
MINPKNQNKPKTAFYWRIRHIFIANELEKLKKGEVDLFDDDPMLNIIKEIEATDFQEATSDAKKEVENIQETIRQAKSWLKLKAFW